MRHLKSFENYKINEGFFGKLFGIKSPEEKYWSKPRAGKDFIKQILNELRKYEANEDNVPGYSDTESVKKSKLDKMMNFIEQTIITYFESYYGDRMTSSMSSILKQSLKFGQTTSIVGSLYIKIDGQRKMIYDHKYEGLCEGELTTLLEDIKSKFDKIVGE